MCSRNLDIVRSIGAGHVIDGSLSRSKFRALRGSVIPERRSQTGADKIGLERNELDLLSLQIDKRNWNNKRRQKND